MRAVSGWQRGRRVPVLDEPTVASSARGVVKLLQLIRDTAVLLISPRLDEAMTIADHARVVQSGKFVSDGSTAEMSAEAFVEIIAKTDPPMPRLDHRRAGKRAGCTRGPQR